MNKSKFKIKNQGDYKLFLHPFHILTGAGVYL